MCSRATRKGQPCQRLATTWMIPEGTPDPAACSTHTTSEERAALAKAQDLWFASVIAEAETARPLQPERRPLHTGPNPACWDWTVPDSFETWTPTFEVGPGDHQYTPEAAESMLRLCEDIERRSWFYLSDWQDGRCAICARTGHLVDDHDHATGLIRGLLCRSCNTREGLNRGSTGIFAAYRERPPTTILGLTIRYLDPFTGEYA